MSNLNESEKVAHLLLNKLLKRLSNLNLFLGEVINNVNIDSKISLLPIWRYPSVNVHLRNSNKQHLILVKVYVNNAPSIGNQIVKFQLNLSKQATVTATFVKSPQNT